MLTLTQKTFDKEVLHAKGTVVVFFKKENCGNCSKMTPIVEKFESENELVKVCTYTVTSKEDPLNERFPTKTVFPQIAYFVDGQYMLSIEGAHGLGMVKLPLKSELEMKGLVYDQIGVIEAAMPYMEAAEKAKKNIEVINSIIKQKAAYSDKIAQEAGNATVAAKVGDKVVARMKEAVKSAKATAVEKPAKKAKTHKK